MLSIKQILSILAAFFWIAGCGGSPSSKSSTQNIKVAGEFDSLDIPEKIPKDERALFERDLLQMPANHPKRIVLRDKIIKLLAAEFSNLKEEDAAGRLELFKQALALHDSLDFLPDKVSADLEPMARWIMKVFEKRGDEAVVLGAQKLLMLENPNDSQIKDDYLELFDWSESIRKKLSDSFERLSSLIDLYKRMITLVPDREIVERLAELYVERYKVISDTFNSETPPGYLLNPGEILAQSRLMQTLPIELIYIFFLTGDPAGARVHLEKLSNESRIKDYIELLDRISKAQDDADSYFTLATHLSQIDRLAGLKAAIRAQRSDPKDSRFPLFIGLLYEDLDQPECAFDFFVEATKIATSQDVFIKVFEIYRRALTKLSQKGLKSQTEKAVEIGDRLVESALKIYPDEETDLRLVTASFLYTMGEIEFDNGNIDSTIRHLERSFDVAGNLKSLVKLSEVYYMLGEFALGIKALDRVSQLLPDGSKPTGYWQAILLENRGNLTDMLGKKDEAQRLYRDALIEWGSAEIPAEGAPLAAIRRGVLLDRLGDLTGSQNAFIQAVRLDPNREATYAQLISFLVIRERLEDSKMFYRLARNQDQIDYTWKIYYSLWVEGLSLRAEKRSFDLANGYLRNSRGDSWQDNLARFFSGDMSEDKIRKKAADFGQQIELEYYAALLAMSKGETAKANECLKKVIDSKLLGFYEYQMAFALLFGQLVTKEPN